MAIKHITPLLNLHFKKSCKQRSGILVRGLASFNGKYQTVIRVDETYLGMIFRTMGSCGKNFSSLGVVATLSAEAYFFGGFT